MKYPTDMIDPMPREVKLKELSPLGEWIKAALNEKGKSQAWLASKVHLQPPQISRIMSGDSNTSQSTLNAIADALGKKRSEIYRVTGNIESIPHRDKEIEDLLHEIAKLPKEDQKEILEFVKVKNKLREGKNDKSNQSGNHRGASR